MLDDVRVLVCELELRRGVRLVQTVLRVLGEAPPRNREHRKDEDLDHFVADEEGRIDEGDDDHLGKEPRVRVPVRICEGLVQRRRMALGDVAFGVGARVVEPSPRGEVDVELGEHVDDDRVQRVGEAVEGDL